MADQAADRPSIPSSAMTEQEERRNRQYDEEARNQDLSDADDEARDKDTVGASSGSMTRPVEEATQMRKVTKEA